MLALPPAPTPPRPRVLLMGTAAVGAAIVMLFGGMLAVYLSLREQAGGTTATWLPDGAAVPGIAANMMLVGMGALCVMAQWAVYAMARGDRRNAAYALVLAVVFAASVINAQAFIWTEMGLGVADSRYAVVFYAITGTFLAVLAGGLVMGLVAAFRAWGGRYSAERHEGLSAFALVCYVLAAVFTAVWLVVYVVK